MKETYDLIARAIIEHRQIHAVYAQLRRSFCPHFLGENDRGRRMVLAYQFAGDSASGIDLPDSHSNWRCFNVDGLYNVILGEQEWHSASNWSAIQSCISKVEVAWDGEW